MDCTYDFDYVVAFKPEKKSTLQIRIDQFYKLQKNLSIQENKQLELTTGTIMKDDSSENKFTPPNAVSNVPIQSLTKQQINIPSKQALKHKDNNYYDESDPSYSYTTTTTTGINTETAKTVKTRTPKYQQTDNKSKNGQIDTLEGITQTAKRNTDTLTDSNIKDCTDYQYSAFSSMRLPFRRWILHNSVIYIGGTLQYLTTPDRIPLDDELEFIIDNCYKHRIRHKSELFLKRLPILQTSGTV
uniref:Uncharacterized protein n=1 Tax=Trichobilharzia regenti TaxID=157069 RepID=A0AA85IX36_TRIRE|nr:unnamed protein product [Trichobilharzia regenti]